jgi:hypothetical protein
VFASVPPTVIIASLAAVFGGGGLVTGIYLLLKLRGENALNVTQAAENAVSVLNTALGSLQAENTRLRDEHKMTEKELEGCIEERDRLEKGWRRQRFLPPDE